MKVKYHISYRGENPNQDCETSLKKAGVSKRDIVYLKKDENFIDTLNSCVSNKGKYTHFVLLNDTDEVTDNYVTIMKKYSEGNEKNVIMPMVHVLDLIEGNKVPKGFFNTCIWKPYLTPCVGILDHVLALKQIDLSLNGVLIPFEIIERYPFEDGYKYYYQFEWLNRITKESEKEFDTEDELFDIIGIPKMLVESIYDTEIKESTQEERTEYFMKCRDKFKTTEADAVGNIQELLK